LGTVNNTLADDEYNENLLKEEISRVTKFANTLRSETNEKMNFFSAKLRSRTYFKGKQCDEYIAA